MMRLLEVLMVTLAVWNFEWDGIGFSNKSIGRISLPAAHAFTVVTISAKDDPDSVPIEDEGDGEAVQTLLVKKKDIEKSCNISSFDPSMLQNPCKLDASLQASPETFSLVFPTQYGNFTADCVRARAPLWADRIYKLARHGYYNDNYFFRVIPGKYAQFGTNGHPDTSNVYNYTSEALDLECSILDPQPPFMTYCMANNTDGGNCKDVRGLSNDFGTIAMSTSYNRDLRGYPQGVTWNATAELFINIGKHNQNLDSHLFVPICTIGREEMETVVLKFPSFGEVAELGGDGPSLGRLYQDGNDYIESNPDWNTSMALTGTVKVCS